MLVGIVEGEKHSHQFCHQPRVAGHSFAVRSHALNSTPTNNIGNHTATTSIDSGSSLTFISPALANTIACFPVPSSKLAVKIASGGILYSEFTCFACPYTIQGEEFQSDFKVIDLKGYDIILGVD